MRGEYLELPSLPLVEPVVIQFVADDGVNPPECWQDTFSTFKRNAADRFSAKTN
jgi:hypothetical protein